MSKQTFIIGLFNVKEPVSPASVPNISRVVVAASNAVKTVNDQTKTSIKRGPYKKIPEAKKLEIAIYASVNGVARAVNHFRKEGLNILEQSTRQWRDKYRRQIKSKGNCKSEQMVTEKVGAPTLLPPALDKDLREYLVALRANGGAVNTRIIRAVAKAIVLSKALAISKKTEAISNFQKNWAKKRGTAYGLVQRKATKSAKAECSENKKICAEFRKSVAHMIQEHSIPP